MRAAQARWLFVALAAGSAIAALAVATHATGRAANAKPTALVAADFNADGRADLAVTDARGNSVAIFLSTPGGLPTAPDQTLRGSGANRLQSPRGIAAGDFNGDGLPDIAVTNFAGRSVSVFLNSGAGIFTGPTTFTVGANPLGIAVGNFGASSANVDVVVVTKSNSTRGAIRLLSGNGDGTFVVQPAIMVGKSPRQVVVGDFGRATALPSPDGRPDVAVTLFGEFAVAVLYGDGNGGLSPPVKFGAAVGLGIAAADFNQDGCLDLLTANQDRTAFDRVDVLFGCTAGGFSNAQDVVLFDHSAHTTAVTVLDFNSDGKIDIAATNSGPTGPGGAGVALMQNDIDLVDFPKAAVFLSPQLCPAGKGPTAIISADFNGDGIPDLAVANQVSHDVTILYGSGTSACASPVQLGMQSVHFLENSQAAISATRAPRQRAASRGR